MTLNKWMGRPQLLPEIFEIVLRPIWWVAGKEQQSPPSSAAEGQRLTEQKSGRQMLLQLSQVFLAFQVHICLFDSLHISLCTYISGSFDQLSLKKACRNCSIDTDISCLSYHHLHNLKLSESCSNHHIHHASMSPLFQLKIFNIS